MKIALFHSTLPSPDRKVGGVEAVVHRLANALAQRDETRVTVFSLTPSPTEAAYQHVQLYEEVPALWQQPTLRWFVLPVLLNRHSFQDYDVLHLHGDDWFYWRRMLPTVRTLHGSALEEARTATSWKREVAQYLLYPLEHLSVRLASLPLAVGPHTAELYRIPHLVNNGVDRDLFRPGPTADRPTLLFVGTWEGRKRGQFLYRTFVNDILTRRPDAHLVMVSDTVSEACRQHPSVTVPDHPSDADLARLYQHAWVFAYPSVYEGFGIPYVEAMATGTAVCCTPNDGARYVLDDGAYGLFADDEEFGDACVRLLKDESLRASYVKKGLDRAQDFSWSTIADTHLAYYEQAQSSSLSTSLQSA